MKTDTKKNVRKMAFVLGFFLLPNILFVLPLIYNEIAIEQIYQDEFGKKQHAENLKLYLQFAGAPGLKEQREVDSIIAELKIKLENKKQGEYIKHKFTENGVHIELAGTSADDLHESALEVLRYHEVMKGSFAEKLYRDGKEPATAPL